MDTTRRRTRRTCGRRPSTLFAGAAVAAIALIAPPAIAGETIVKPQFTFTLPDGWVEVPSDTLNAINDEIQRLSPGGQVPRYDYAFQLESAQTALEYPYVFVEVFRRGPFTDRQLVEMPKTDLNQHLRHVAVDFQDVASGLSVGQTLYDEASQRLWTTHQATVRGAGPVLGLSGLVLTTTGFVGFHGYSTAPTFERWAPVFREIAMSASVPPHMARQPASGGSASFTMDWRRVGWSAVLGGGVAVVVLLLARRLRR